MVKMIPVARRKVRISDRAELDGAAVQMGIECSAGRWEGSNRGRSRRSSETRDEFGNGDECDHDRGCGA